MDVGYEQVSLNLKRSIAFRSFVVTDRLTLRTRGETTPYFSILISCNQRFYVSKKR